MRWRSCLAAGCAVTAMLLSSGFALLAANTLVVSPGMSIQTAINAASPGDTILIQNGTYDEALEVPAAKSDLTIQGESQAGVIIKPSGAKNVNTAGIYVNNGVSGLVLTNFTFDGSAASYKRYGIKFGTATGCALSNVTSRNCTRTGVDLLGTADMTVTNVSSLNNANGHGMQLCDCSDITLSGITVSGNAWQGVSVCTWGKYTPLGTSGIVVAGTNNFVDVFQIEEGDYAHPGVPPSGEAVISYSVDGSAGADVTFLSDDFNYVLHGTQDDSPAMDRVWFAETFDDAAAVAAVPGPVGHLFPSGRYIENLVDRSLLYASPGCSIQAAINAAQDGTTINVTAGTFDERLTIPSIHGLTLRGSGQGTILKPSSAPAGAKIIDITGADVLIDGFAFDFLGVAGNRVAINCLDSSVTFHGNTFANLSASDAAGYYSEIMAYAKAPGLSDSTRARVVFENNVFVDAGRVAVLAHYFVDLTVKNNVFVRTIDDFGYAIELGSQAVGSIVGNVILGYDTPALSDGSASGGIYIENCFTSTAFGGSGHVDKTVVVMLNTIFNNQVGIVAGNEWDGYAGDVDILVTAAQNWVLVNDNAGVQIADEDREDGSSVTYEASENTVSGNGIGYSIYTYGDGDVTVRITNDEITLNGIGVHVADYAAGASGSAYEVSIHGSSIVGNGEGIVDALDGITVDATLNWWGDPSGPSGEGSGLGDSVSGNVLFSPWLGSDPDGDAAAPGVQITGPVLIVVDDVGPVPAGGYLDAAIEGANGPMLPYDDTILVQEGSFTASAPITAAATLASAGGATATLIGGSLQLNAEGVIVGGMRTGFSIHAPIRVGAGIDASTIHINWNDIYDVVTNDGTSTLDATYNFWGEDGPDTVGDVDVAPYLPQTVDTIIGYMDEYRLEATQAIALADFVLAGLSERVAKFAVALVEKFGLSGQQVMGLIEEYGLGAVRRAYGAAGTFDEFLHLLLGYETNAPTGGAGGGAGGNADGYVAGSIVPLFLEMTDPTTGAPVTDAHVSYTVTRQLADGSPEFVGFGMMTYDAATGGYSAAFDTTGLAPGEYTVWFGADDGSTQSYTILVTE